MPTRMPRWTWPLVLSLLVGALLLMHGFDAQSGDSHPSRTSVSTAIVDEHPYGEPTSDDHGHCVDCLAGHAMAACVAIVTAIGGIGLVRRLLVGAGSTALAAAVAGRVVGLVELARAPDPAWVRLSVMRC